MNWKLPPGVHGYKTQHGKPVFYFRRPGVPKIRLHGHPGSAEFMRAYDAAKAGQQLEIGASRTKPGTVNAAIASYYSSAAWKVLSDGTRSSRRAILERFREECGAFQVAGMPSVAIQNILNRKTPAAQRNWLKALRGWIEHCVNMKFIPKNPLADVKLVKMKKTGGFLPWSEGDIEQYRKRHAPGTKARLALEILLTTGHARSDVVRMGRQHVKGGKLSMRRQKTGVQFDIPLLPELIAELELHPRSEQLAFLYTEYGKQFTAAGFGNWFADRCREAGVPGRAHGLRKASAIRHALNGVTAPELMAWHGWKTIGEAQRYIEEANRIRLAESAAAKIISGTGIGSPSDPVSQNQTQSIEKTGAGK